MVYTDEEVWAIRVLEERHPNYVGVLWEGPYDWFEDKRWTHMPPACPIRPTRQERALGRDLKEDPFAEDWPK